MHAQSGSSLLVILPPGLGLSRFSLKRRLLRPRPIVLPPKLRPAPTIPDSSQPFVLSPRRVEPREPVAGEPRPQRDKPGALRLRAARLRPLPPGLRGQRHPANNGTPNR